MGSLKDLVVKLTSDTSQFEAGMDRAVKKTKSLSDQMGKYGQMMTLGLTVPLLGAATAAVKLASDLEETTNKARVVFGKMGDEMIAFGKTGAKTMGLSTESTLKYASTFGSLLKNMGLTGEETARYSKLLTEMVADYASFHNLSPEVAFEKIRAGLVGSSEPLLSLGKDLRVAAVEAYALANGLDMTTASGKALATIGALQAQSKDELGDYIRTSDGLANSTRSLGESVKDLGASIGELLMPDVVEMVHTLADWTQKLNDLDPTTKQAIINVLKFVAVIGPVMWGVSKIIILVGWLKTAWGWLSKVGGTISIIKGVWTGFALAITTATVPIWWLIVAIAALVLAIIFLGKKAETAAEQLAFIIGQLFKNLWAWVSSLPDKFFKTGQDVIAGLIGGIQSKVASLIDGVKNPMELAVKAANDAVKTGSPSQVFRKIGENMMLGLEQGINSMANIPVKATVDGIPTSISSNIAGGRKSGIGDVYIYGDMSPAMKENLRVEIKNIFNTEMNNLMAGA